MNLNPYVFSIDMLRSNLCFKRCFLFKKRHTIPDSWITRLQINLIARYLKFCSKIIRGANILGFLLLHVKCLCIKIHSTPGIIILFNN
jgi:hypothetical protein